MWSKPVDEDVICSIACTRLPNGRDVVVHDGDLNALNVVDLRTGRPVRSIDTKFSGPRGPVVTGALPDGRVVVAAANTRIIRLWELATGTGLAQIQTAPGLGVSALTFATLPSGVAVLISADALARGIRVWRLPDGKPLGPLLRGGFKGGQSFRNHPQHDDGSIELWWDVDDESGKPLFGITALTAAELPDGRVVAAAGGDEGMVCVWDLSTHRLIGTTNVGSKVTRAVSTGAEALFSDECGRIHQVDLGTVTVSRVLTTGHHGAVTELATTTLPDGRTAVVTAGPEDAVRVLDLTSGDPIGHPLRLDGQIHALAVVARRRGPHVLIGGRGMACLELGL